MHVFDLWKAVTIALATGVLVFNHAYAQQEPVAKASFEASGGGDSNKRGIGGGKGALLVPDLGELRLGGGVQGRKGIGEVSLALAVKSTRDLSGNASPGKPMIGASLVSTADYLFAAGVLDWVKTFARNQDSHVSHFGLKFLLGGAGSRTGELKDSASGLFLGASGEIEAEVVPRLLLGASTRLGSTLHTASSGKDFAFVEAAAWLKYFLGTKTYLRPEVAVEHVVVKRTNAPNESITPVTGSLSIGVHLD